MEGIGSLTFMKNFAGQALNHLNFIIFLIGVFIIIGILWTPIGLHNIPKNGEEWFIIRLVNDSPGLVPAPGWPTRPLRWVAYIIAYQLAPNSLIGFNIMLISLFALRGVLAYLICTQLFPDKPDIAFATGVAFLLYPTGRGFFDMNTLNLQTALVLGLLSIYVVLLYWRTKKLWLWILIWTAQILSLLTYELYYSVFIIIPILFWWIDQRIEFSRRFMRITATWYFFYAILIIRFLSVIRSRSSDYVSLTLDNNINRNSMLDAAVYAIPRLYFDHLVAWQRQLWHLNQSTSYFVTTLVGGILVGVLVLWAQQLNQLETPTTLKQPRDYLLSSGYALLFMIMAFAIYIPVYKIFDMWRTYFAASLGAAFLTAIVFHLMLRLNLPFKKLMYSVGMVLVVLIGTNYHLIQLQKTADIATFENQLIAAIVEEVPATDHPILVIDNNNIYSKFFIGNGLDAVLDYIYERPMEIWLCRLNPNATTRCDFRDDQVVVTIRNWKNTFAYDYADIIVFYILADGTLIRLNDIQYLAGVTHPEYQPQNLIEDTAYPTRAYTYFTCFPFSKCDSTSEDLPVERLISDFDTPVKGMGFQYLGGEQTHQWMTGNYALLKYSLVPNQDYIITFLVRSFNDHVYDNLQIDVNDRSAKFIQQVTSEGRKINVFVSADMIEDSSTLIEFKVDTNAIPEDLHDQTLLFDWLTIEPLTGSEFYPTNELRLDFDSPVWGENWSPPSSSGRVWTLGQRSTLYLPLATNQAYSLEFAVATYKPEILDGVSIQINDLAITLERENQNDITIFRGTIPVGILNTYNWLEIMTEDTFTPLEVGLGNDTRELGLFFDWLEIKPIVD